ncbi:filamin/ABP280 repeat-containing protein [Babesia caballi]|uniref:Filamin/ABP280 repeat-containing protein n=1 Tax=Babesia caballi TaxID=5871 RepID=A0AAV4LRY6_BABCB|nr:filamin/ABP280 repeat-containing protein [Babesia caballi]
MAGCVVQPGSAYASATDPVGYQARDVIAQPATTHLEGDGIHGGECGKWLKFVVRKHGSVTRGVVRLNLEDAEDADFRSSVFINHKADERDLLRAAPSCQNNRLANNAVADSLEHNFLWDVCVVDGETFNIRYRVTRKGTFLLHVKIDGNPVPGSPFRIYISDAPPFTPACRVYGRNIHKCNAIPYVQEIIETVFPDAAQAAEAAVGDPGDGSGQRSVPYHEDSTEGGSLNEGSDNSAISIDAPSRSTQGTSYDSDRYISPASQHGGARDSQPGSEPDHFQSPKDHGSDVDVELGSARNRGCATSSSVDSLCVNLSADSTTSPLSQHSHIKEPPRTPATRSNQPWTKEDAMHVSNHGSPADGLSNNAGAMKDTPREHLKTLQANKRTSTNSSSSGTRLVGLPDEDWAEEAHRRRQHTLRHLEQNSLLNEIDVHLADEHGNVVTHALPYVRAWGDNFARVVSVDHEANGIVRVKYLVVVPRDGVAPLKEAQAREKDSVLPRSLRVGGVPCKINVEINGKPVFGSPFHPQVANVEELEKYYESKPGTAESLVRRFSDLVQNQDFDSCAELYRTVDTPELKDRLTGILLTRISELEKNNITITSDITKVESLKLQSLGRLLELVQSQYKKMLTYKTSNIVDCIRELKSFETMGADPAGRGALEHDGADVAKKFNNLGDVILNYRLIGDELRKLHRYELADKFDQINDQMCDEIDLGMWTSIIANKESHVQRLRTEVELAADRLARFKGSLDERYKNFTRTDLDDLRRLPGFAFEQASQTKGPDLITTRLSPLVRGRCVPASAHGEVDMLVEAHWRKCNNYDIQATVAKVLKSSVRLKNSISELFAYYSTAHPREAGQPLLGVSRVSVDLFVLEARLNSHLTANVRKLDWLFERFSVELAEARPGAGAPPPRAIPEHLWCAYLRELGYLNLLYTIAESGDREMLRDFQHPSRLVAFHHLCKEHLTPLYELLFTTKPEFQKCLKFPDSQVASGSQRTSKAASKVAGPPPEQYFRSRQDILNYFNVRALEHVLSAIDIDVLQLVFKHYSRISTFGRLPVSRGWFDENATMSTATFVVFARDFQIIPGHMDGESVHAIARGVAMRGQAGSSKLALRDFVSALSRTLARAVLAGCLAKHDAYELSRDALAQTAESVPPCVESKESVKRDIRALLQSLGLCDLQFIRVTIDAIYGSEALEQIDDCPGGAV